MTYHMAAIRVTPSDLQGHAAIASVSKCDVFVQLCSCSQDFD